MDMNQLLSQDFSVLISPYNWLIPSFILAVFLKTAFVKDVFAKLYVNLALKFLLNKQYYTVFKQVNLATGMGIIHIEHLIVSQYGLFVLKTLTTKASVFNHSRSGVWLQSVNEFAPIPHSPDLTEHYSHALHAALEIDPDKVFSIFILAGRSTPKTAMPHNIVQPSRCTLFIKHKTQIILSKDEVLTICEKIQTEQLTPVINYDNDHIKHIKVLVENKPQPHDILCPKCGKKMILRTARRDNNQGKQFLGCSDYPKCTMVRQLV
jgi:restriction system protein